MTLLAVLLTTGFGFSAGMAATAYWDESPERSILWTGLGSACLGSAFLVLF